MFKNFLLSICCLCFTLNSFAGLNPTTIKKPQKYQFQSHHFNKHPHIKSSKLERKYFHTQIFKFGGTTDQINCDDLYNYITYEIFPDLFEHDFYYSGLLVCFPEENKIEYTFNGLFEPSDDDASNVAKKMLAELEGREVYGSTIHFYEAKAIIYNLLMTIGYNSTKDEEAIDDFYYDVQSTSLRQNSLQEAYDKTFDEIYENFKPTDAKLFLPLTTKLFGELASPAIEQALHKGNSVRLIALPMFLYGDNLSIYKDIVGAYFIGEFCDLENQKTCL